MSNITVRDQLNSAPPSILADIFRDLGIADLLLGQCNQQLRKQNPGTAGANSPYDLSTLSVIVLPDNAKASRMLRCTVRAGGTTGEYTEKAGYGTTPTTTTVGVTPCGNLAFLGTDLVTDADLTYIAERLDVVELYLPVVSGTGVLTIPSALVTQGVVLLMEAEALAGTSTGKKIVLVPAASAAAGRAVLSVAKDTVIFNTTDAVTRARVKLGVAPSKALQTKLLADAQYP